MKLTGTRIFILVIGLLWAIFQLVVLGLKPIDPWYFRSLHITFAALLAFAIFPAFKKETGEKITWWDWLWIAGALASTIYLFLYLDEMINRAGVVPTTADAILGFITTLVVLEMTRRTSGLALPIIAILFILYAVFGNLLPDFLAIKGYPFERIMSFIYSDNGVFGPTTGTSATYVYLFVLFGAFLETSGGGKFFIEFATSIAGWARGGPAKVAVLSSGLMGTISGTAVGNVVTTGTFTIPLMKKTGYRPSFAGAVEAVASTGGQILPPVMGAAAFVMAQITGIPYSKIILAAAIPALLYYAGVYFGVDLEAQRTRLKGLPSEEIPKLGPVMREFFFFIPVLVLIYILITGGSIIRAGMVAIGTCILVSWFSLQKRMGFRRLIEAMVKGSRDAVAVAAACATAGVVVAIVSLTGVGVRFASIVQEYANGNLLVGLILSMLVALVLGMGLPTVAAYAIAASVVAPALVNLGLQPLPAHLFIFYFACISAITPPVALAAYAGAGIAGANPNEVGFNAVKLGLSAFIVPYMFIYGPALMGIGTPVKVGLAALSALLGVFCLAVAGSGYLRGTLNPLFRLLVLGAALLLIKPGIGTDLAGATILTGVYFAQYKLAKLQYIPAPGANTKQIAMKQKL